MTAVERIGRKEVEVGRVRGVGRPQRRKRVWIQDGELPPGRGRSKVRATTPPRVAEPRRATAPADTPIGAPSHRGNSGRHLFFLVLGIVLVVVVATALGSVMLVRELWQAFPKGESTSADRAFYFAFGGTVIYLAYRYGIDAALMTLVVSLCAMLAIISLEPEWFDRFSIFVADRNASPQLGAIVALYGAIALLVRVLCPVRGRR